MQSAREKEGVRLLWKNNELFSIGAIEKVSNNFSYNLNLYVRREETERKMES